MTWPRLIYDTVAAIVRPAALALFAAEILAIGGSWAAPRRPHHDLIFWNGLGDSSALLAAGSLVVCLLLTVFSRFCGDHPRQKTAWCVMLNLATLTLMVICLPPVQNP